MKRTKSRLGARLSGNVFGRGTATRLLSHGATSKGGVGGNEDGPANLGGKVVEISLSIVKNFD